MTLKEIRDKWEYFLADQCEDDPVPVISRQVRFMAALIEAERKACAEIARAHEVRALKAGASVTAGWCLDIAAAIEARGERK